MAKIEEVITIDWQIHKLITILKSADETLHLVFLLLKHEHDYSAKQSYMIMNFHIITSFAQLRARKRESGWGAAGPKIEEVNLTIDWQIHELDKNLKKC